MTALEKLIFDNTTCSECGADMQKADEDGLSLCCGAEANFHPYTAIRLLSDPAVIAELFADTLTDGEKLCLEVWLSPPNPCPVHQLRALLPKEADSQAGTCAKCGDPVVHRPGKPGEYDHECKDADDES